MNIEDVFFKIKIKIEAGNIIWSRHAIDRLKERFHASASVTRTDIKKAIISNGEVIRFEWQYGYEPRILVYAECIILDDQGISYNIPFHASVKSGEKAVIITLYNDLYEFEADNKTRQKKYFSRKKDQ